MILTLFVLSFITCKKETVKPAPVKPCCQNQFVYRSEGKADTAIVWLNNVKLKDSTLNYSLTLNKGDTLRFHYYSQDLKFNFAIWHDWNKLPIEVHYFYPKSYISQSVFYPTGIILDGYFTNND